jgi:hypothetical protein
MQRQFRQQRPRLLRRDPPHASFCFAIQRDLRNPLDPFPLQGGLAQDRADQRQVAIGRGWTGFLGLDAANFRNYIPGDTAKLLAAKILRVE